MLHLKFPDLWYVPNSYYMINNRSLKYYKYIAIVTKYKLASHEFTIFSLQFKTSYILTNVGGLI